MWLYVSRNMCPWPRWGYPPPICWESEFFFTVDDGQGFEQPSIKTPDPASVADADAFEELTGSIALSSVMAIDNPPGNSSPGVPEELGPQTIQTDTGTLKTGSTVIIDHFPSHAAGAAVPGIPHGHSIYELYQAGLWTQTGCPFGPSVTGQLHDGQSHVARLQQQCQNCLQY